MNFKEIKDALGWFGIGFIAFALIVALIALIIGISSPEMRAPSFVVSAVFAAFGIFCFVWCIWPSKK